MYHCCVLDPGVAAYLANVETTERDQRFEQRLAGVALVVAALCCGFVVMVL